MSAPTKRPATDEALESEPASKRVCVVASLDPADATDEKKEKWYHANHAICSVQVRVGDKWCLHLTDQQWWDTESEYMREYMDPTTKTIDLPPTTFNSWKDLVSVFDWIVEDYKVDGNFTMDGMLDVTGKLTPHDIVREIKLMAFLGCHRKVTAQLEVIENKWCKTKRVSATDLIEWAGVFKSKALWKGAAERCLCDNGTTLPDPPPPELTRAMVEWYRENSVVDEKLTQISGICQQFIDSHKNPQIARVHYGPTGLDDIQFNYQRQPIHDLIRICQLMGIQHK